MCSFLLLCLVHGSVCFVVSCWLLYVCCWLCVVAVRLLSFVDCYTRLFGVMCWRWCCLLIVVVRSFWCVVRCCSHFVVSCCSLFVVCSRLLFVVFVCRFH